MSTARYGHVYTLCTYTPLHGCRRPGLRGCYCGDPRVGGRLRVSHAACLRCITDRFPSCQPCSLPQVHYRPIPLVIIHQTAACAVSCIPYAWRLRRPKLYAILAPNIALQIAAKHERIGDIAQQVDANASTRSPLLREIDAFACVTLPCQEPRYP